jgi:chemotaxis protein methyltransferase CheR
MMAPTEYNEMESLFVRIRELSGFDFSGYSRPSLHRRINAFLKTNNLVIAELIDHVGTGDITTYDLIQDLTVNYSEMFRDPEFFVMIRSEVLSYLESFASLRCWVAGCASGEEAFSLAILLKEEGLDGKSIIYATDLNQKVLRSAEQGALPLHCMQGYAQNYANAKGRFSLSGYYEVNQETAVIDYDLRKNIVFSVHDLTGDGVFNQFQMISCRNVLIYFTLEQKRKVLWLLYDSLAMFGFLCLGKRESMRYSGLEDKFRVISIPLNIYQKIQ